MIWDWLVQLTAKYCAIRRIEYTEFQTGIFGRMESAHIFTEMNPFQSSSSLTRGAVSRDGTKKSRANSGQARFYKFELANSNLLALAGPDFARAFLVPSRLTAPGAPRVSCRQRCRLFH